MQIPLPRLLTLLEIIKMKFLLIGLIGRFLLMPFDMHGEKKVALPDFWVDYPDSCLILKVYYGIPVEKSPKTSVESSFPRFLRRLSR